MLQDSSCYLRVPLDVAAVSEIVQGHDLSVFTARSKAGEHPGQW